MKSLAHPFWLTFGLCLAALTSGCVNTGPRSAQRIEPASDIEVVETSARRPLTAREMGELRGTVARYLEQQGQTDSGDYYLKVYLTPDQEGVTPEWVVVRFTRYSDTRVAIASGSAVDQYPYSSSYYSYDLYPGGYYDGFNRISFQYYDDPFFGPRYYYPRYEHRGRDRNWDRGRDHGRDRDHGRPGDHRPGDRPPGGQPPGGVVTNPPPRPENPRRRTPDRIAPTPPRSEVGERPRRPDRPVGDGRPLTTPSYRPSGPSNPSRPAEPARQWRGRTESGPSNNSAARPVAPPQRTEARNEPRASSPPPAPRVQSDSRSNPPTPERADNSRRNLP